jgi:uncharacterized protein YceK
MARASRVLLGRMRGNPDVSRETSARHQNGSSRTPLKGQPLIRPINFLFRILDRSMKSKIITLLITCLISVGCSTLTTLDSRSSKYYPYTEMTNECQVFDKHGIKQQPVYSGSRNALSYIVLPWTCSGEACWGAFFYPLYLPFSLIDFSFSALADTMVLPYTYNLQYKECPNVNWSALAMKKELLTERIRFYYSDYSNPKHIWALASSSFKGEMTKDQFVQYLYKNKFIYKSKNGDFVTETIIINKNKARVLIYDKLTKYRILPWYDYWLYENDNWFINQPNRKTEYTLMLEKQSNSGN